MARKEGLVIQETPDELLVYDLNTNKAHCLNQTAAFVWKSCDGKNSVSEITNLFKRETGEEVKEDLVRLAIDQLSGKDLLEGEIALSFGGQSRRQVIKKIGLATVVALPLISSLAAPTSVLAAGSCACPPLDCATATGCPATTCNTVGVCAPEPPAPPLVNPFKTKQP